jgi:hypothetical protein
MMSTYSDSNSSISSSSSYIIENNNMVLNQNCVTIPQPPPPPVPVSAPMMMSEYSENEDAMFMDMSSFDYGVLPQQQNFMTEGDPVSMPVTMNGCYVPCSSSSMTSTPTALSSSFEESSLLYDGPDELTTLLHNVLNDDSSRWTNSSRSSVDMTRTTSSSSAPRVCGSLTPHHCGPPVDPQGQSVVITITPLFEDVKPMTTKIVTCYCGSACQCPGCFVHQHESSSSSYSSDDEELCA